MRGNVSVKPGLPSAPRASWLGALRGDCHEGRLSVHETPEGYGRSPYPHQPQGQGGYPPQQPYPGPGGPGQGGPGQGFPGQGYPGQGYPGEAGRPPYGEGLPPYGGGPPYGGQQPPGGPWGPGGYGPPGPGGPGGPTGPGGPGWGPPPGPPNKNSGLIVVVAIVAVLVVLGGGGAIVWALSSGGGHPSTPIAQSSAPLPPDTPSGLPTAVPTPSESVPVPTPSDDVALTAKPGECVRNTGSDSKPHLIKVSCHAGAYKVLKRFYATSSASRCKSVHGYNASYTRKNSKYSVLSFVLCLKKL